MIFRTFLQAGMQFITWQEYCDHVEALEELDMTTSDAQGVVDCELMKRNIGVTDE